MKRALFVSAGTVAGVVAVLSYSPGGPDVVGLGSPTAAHVAGNVTDGADPAPSVTPSRHLSRSGSPAPRPSKNAKKEHAAAAPPPAAAGPSGQAPSPVARQTSSS